MCAFRVALALLLLGALRAFPQGRAPMDPCAGKPRSYYDKAARRCCYQCPSGLSPQQLCGKQCEPDYYVDGHGRCTACVSCGDDLVEKRPCSWNSPRVCECQAGMYCDTSATNSCARCMPHSICPAGLVVKVPGTAERDTVCEPPSPGTGPNCSTSPQDCKPPVSSTGPRAEPVLTPGSSDAGTVRLEGDTHLSPEGDSETMKAPNSRSSEGKPSPGPGLSLEPLCPLGSAGCRNQCELCYYLDEDSCCMACVSCPEADLVEKTPCWWNSSCICECNPDLFCATSATNSCAHCITCPAAPPETVTKLQGAPSAGRPILVSGPALWVTAALVVVIGSSFLLLCHRRACWKWIRQKLHLCRPVPTYQPRPEPVDSRPRKNRPELQRSLLVTEPCTGQPGFPTARAVETRPSVGAAGLDSLPLLGASPAESPSPPGDLPESRATAEHTNNRIEKIYIMKADTVIVGTVKTEAPEGRGPAGPALEAGLEADHAPRYPEQETEPPLGSCGDVMFSVEEEGKGGPLPAADSGK